MSLILTCPECATRYVANAEEFAPPGRTVRCSRCEHSWFEGVSEPVAYETLFDEFDENQQAPRTGDDQIASDQSADPLAEPETVEPLAFEDELNEFERDLRSDTDLRGDFDVAPFAEKGPAFGPSGGPSGPSGGGSGEFSDDFAPNMGPDISYNEPPPPGSRRGSRVISALVGLFGTVAVALIVIAAGWYFRPQIISALPQVEALYAFLPSPQKPGTFDLQNTGYIEAAENGQPVLIVSGEVVNRTDQPVPVPVVRVTVRNINGEDLDQWEFTPRGQDIRPGEERYFETRRFDPPDGAQRLHLIVIEKK